MADKAQAVKRKKRREPGKAGAVKTGTTGGGKARGTAKQSAPRKSVPRKSVPRARDSARPAATTVNPSQVPGRATGRAPDHSLLQTLQAEHRHISTVMQLFTEQLGAIEGGELVDTHVVYEIMHYMVTWPDRFHHPREDLIYARVAEVDPGAEDNVNTLQRDHDHMARLGRSVLRDIERWRLGEVLGTVVVKSGRAYIEHYFEHMNLEEQLVFPHIEKTLSAQDWRELAEDDALQAVSESIFGPQVQREFRNMTRKLRRVLRRSVERGALVEWMGVEALMESLEVMSIAYESARGTAGDYLRGAVREGYGYFREDPLTAPLRVAANNTRIAFRLLGEVIEISRDTLDDLSRVNRERKARIRLLDRDASRR